MNFVSNAKIATFLQVKVAELTQNSENMKLISNIHSTTLATALTTYTHATTL